MIRCLVEECKHNDDGFCDEHGFFSPTIDYMDGCLLPPVCSSFQERDYGEDGDGDG